MRFDVITEQFERGHARVDLAAHRAHFVDAVGDAFLLQDVHPAGTVVGLDGGECSVLEQRLLPRVHCEQLLLVVRGAEVLVGRRRLLRSIFAVGANLWNERITLAAVKERE